MTPERKERIGELARKLADLRLQYECWAIMNTPNDPVERADGQVRGALLVADINDTKLLLQIEQQGQP